MTEGNIDFDNDWFLLKDGVWHKVSEQDVRDFIHHLRLFSDSRFGHGIIFERLLREIDQLRHEVVCLEVDKEDLLTELYGSL